MEIILKAKRFFESAKEKRRDRDVKKDCTKREIQTNVSVIKCNDKPQIVTRILKEVSTSFPGFIKYVIFTLSNFPLLSAKRAPIFMLFYFIGHKSTTDKTNAQWIQTRATKQSAIKFFRFFFFFVSVFFRPQTIIFGQ